MSMTGKEKASYGAATPTGFDVFHLPDNDINEVISMTDTTTTEEEVKHFIPTELHEALRAGRAYFEASDLLKAKDKLIKQLESCKRFDKYLLDDSTTRGALASLIAKKCIKGARRSEVVNALSVQGFRRSQVDKSLGELEGRRYLVASNPDGENVYYQTTSYGMEALREVCSNE